MGNTERVLEMAQQQNHHLPPGYHPHHNPVGPFNPNKTHDDIERWVCIYPAYINSKKTITEGRIIAKDKCVENPNFNEIKAVLDDAGVTFLLEKKLYPRERRKENDFIGRFRVHLKKADGSPVLDQFPTRESIMLYLCEKIPQLKSRTNPPKGGGESSHQGQGAGGGQKGKGKKGKK